MKAFQLKEVLTEKHRIPLDAILLPDGMMMMVRMILLISNLDYLQKTESSFLHVKRAHIFSTKLQQK